MKHSSNARRVESAKHFAGCRSSTGGGPLTVTLAAISGQSGGISGAGAEGADNRAIWVHGSSDLQADNGWCAMSVFQYGAEAYRLLLTLVGLIVGTLFGPLRLVTISTLLLCIGAGIWFISIWLRRRNRAQMN